MSRIDTIDVRSLRARLTHALRLDVTHDGSLYLHALGACYLACSDDGEEQALERLFYGQASFEVVNGDDVLSALILVAGGVS